MSNAKTRIMYIEDKSEGLNGPARIGRVTFSKSGRSLRYRGRTFLRVGSGYKYNHVAEDNGDRFWISGPRKDGADRLYASALPVEIDADVESEYWRDIRGIGQPA
ncbi:1-deoxy-D-xylulose-5-phosphate synthase [Croceicoccus sediminis]|uniref:1-deoxy-D-xylulose-5-phosphate synthase n=1 Tax=Croceicoccus sediminis TaxID=2571150 RepID=UPI001184066C|nr:1-deoxy-D-xylulose-5-phosphate synthase [Croceicoccus sediminis]